MQKRFSIREHVKSETAFSLEIEVLHRELIRCNGFCDRPVIHSKRESSLEEFAAFVLHRGDHVDTIDLTLCVCKHLSLLVHIAPVQCASLILVTALDHLLVHICVFSRADFMETKAFVVQFNFAEVGDVRPIRFQLVEDVSIVDRPQSDHVVGLKPDAPRQCHLVYVARAEWNLPALELHDNLVVSIGLSMELIEL